METHGYGDALIKPILTHQPPRHAKAFIYVAQELDMENTTKNLGYVFFAVFCSILETTCFMK